jgi:hypothetical protein
MKKKLKRVLSYLKYIITILIIIIPIHGFVTRFIENKPLIINSILNPSTYATSKAEMDERKQYITEIFLQHLTTTTQFETNHQQIIMQTRLFYAAILAALFTVAILSEKKSFKIWLIIFITCVSMYGIDTHLRDLGIRLHHYAKIVDNTRDVILNILPNDTTYYNLNYDVFETIDNEYAKYPDLYMRKINLAIKPDLLQSIYYFLPMGVGWFSYLRTTKIIRIKKRLIRNSNRSRL